MKDERFRHNCKKKWTLGNRGVTLPTNVDNSDNIDRAREKWGSSKEKKKHKETGAKNQK